MSGAQDGGLVKWQGTTAGKPIKQHTDGIWAIQSTSATSFISGGNDGKIIFWNASMAATKTFDLAGQVKFSPGIRSLDVSPNGTLLVGTRGSDVVELDQTGQVQQTIV